MSKYRVCFKSHRNSWCTDFSQKIFRLVSDLKFILFEIISFLQDNLSGVYKNYIQACKGIYKLLDLLILKNYLKMNTIRCRECLSFPKEDDWVMHEYLLKITISFSHLLTNSKIARILTPKLQMCSRIQENVSVKIFKS